MVGEQIRKLRKQKKLTLEELAGTELTKGMLSLIENNKANPSMESLAYIAERLGVDMAQLLNEGSVAELREVLEQAEKIFNIDAPDKYSQLVHLIEPHVSKLHQGYEAARLLEIYGRSLFRDNKPGWQDPINKAADLYDQMNIAPRRARIGVSRSNVHFIEKNYEKALEILLDERREIEEKYAYIDPFTKLELDYHEAVQRFAVGDEIEAIRVMEEAITFSNLNKTFYLIDDLYRLAAFYALMVKNEELQEHYIMKLKQYAEFSGDRDAMCIYHLFYIFSLNNVKQDYKSALEMIDLHLGDPDFTVHLKQWLYLEKGKALHGLGEYKEAIHHLDLAEIPPYFYHPFDLSQFYLKDTYKALCYAALENHYEALSCAKTAALNFERMPASPYKDFSSNTYHGILEKVNGEPS